MRQSMKAGPYGVISGWYWAGGLQAIAATKIVLKTASLSVHLTIKSIAVTARI